MHTKREFVGRNTIGNFGVLGCLQTNLIECRNCLLARRLVERGVRFINIIHASWDHHDALQKDLSYNCSVVDQPIGALLRDLKQRGLLDDTLVVVTGEFGRTPMVQGTGKPDGRDHHNRCFTMWLAGGGVQPGLVYGKTDDYGYYAVEDKVHFHDLHATILHMMGLDHEKLVYRYSGRDFRLTDVYGRVVHEILV